jgi:hypothetical protein
VVNAVEDYAWTHWLDVYCDSIGFNKGQAIMAFIPGLEHKDQYKGVQLIAATD